MSLYTFVTESNGIEGIRRAPTVAEIEAHERFLAQDDPDINDLELFVGVIAPKHPLRRKLGMDVRVGNHIAPRGGPEIVSALESILIDAINGGDPYTIHRRYETLHPFMDGNGRSGRVLWLWMMQGRGKLEYALALGFLHAWYYQSLSASRSPQPKE